MGAAFAAAPILAGAVIASTAVAAGAAIFAGVQQARAAREQREQEELREQQLAVQGVQQSNQILEDEIAALAAVNVTAGASGIDPFTGAPNQTAQRIRARANRQLQTTSLGTAFEIAGSQSRQRQLSLQGDAALIRAAGAAGGSLLGGATRLQAIG